MHPIGKRVSSLLTRVGTHITGGRHTLIAALAGGVTRSLASCLLRHNVGIRCLRSSISALHHIRLLHVLHRNGVSIVINVGLLHRNLSLPRMSLITVLSTSGRKFLHSCHSLVRAVNHTTQGISNAIVVCTSRAARTVQRTVSRASHHHTGRVTCGRRRNVSPGPLVGGVDSIGSVLTGRSISARALLRNNCHGTNGTNGARLNIPMLSPGRTSGHRRRVLGTNLPTRSLTSLVHRLDRRVRATTRRLRFRLTTHLHSRVQSLGGRLHRVARTGGWPGSRAQNKRSTLPRQPRGHRVRGLI